MQALLAHHVWHVASVERDGGNDEHCVSMQEEGQEGGG